jgi:hypothetical protein
MLRAIGQGAEVVAFVDADLSTPLSELERMLEVLDDTGADAVLGARVGLAGYDVRRSALRHYLGRVFATAASLVLGSRIYDTQCGAKAFRVSPLLEQALAAPLRTRWVFDVELLGRMLAADGAVRLVEVPLRKWSDVAGSKLSPWHMLRAAWELWLLARPRLRRKSGAGSLRGRVVRQARRR